MNKGRVVAAGFAIALALVATWEGLRLIDYRDPIGIPTACYGHTGPDVELGKQRTAKECRALLSKDLQEAWDGVDRCITVLLEPQQHAAFASFAFNVGVSAFCRSTLVRLANAGNIPAACDQLLRWKFAGGKALPGLIRRREAERRVCLGGEP